MEVTRARRSLAGALEGLSIMAASDRMDMKSRPRIGMRCFSAWCVAVSSVIAAALTHGVQPSVFLHVDEGGRVNLWQALVFSLSMSAFGFWMALTTKLRRIPEDPGGLRTVSSCTRRAVAGYLPSAVLSVHFA